VRRRIVLATCGAVLAALVLAGLGTLALARLDARASTRTELEQQSRALAAVFETIGDPLQGGTGSLQAPAVRQRLRQLARGMDLQDLGFLVSGPLLNYRGDLPQGVVLSPVQMDELRAGEVVSGTHGKTVYAAAPGTHTRTLADGTTQIIDGFVVVLTAHPTSAASAAGRWFVLASAGTLALAAILAITLSRRFARPITAARDAAHRIASGDFAARVPDPPPRATDELADLSRSINTMAEALERSRGLDRQFLMSVSHDLRTPMASIQGYAEALTDGAIEPDRAAAVIMAESKRLDRLVTDLLLLSRLDARSFTLDIRPEQVAPVVAATAAGFLPRAVERGIALDMRAASDPLVANIDADRVAQIVANLIENALKFARTRISVEVQRDRGWVVISVADDGPGIAAEDLPHVFERLYVATHRPTPKESGSGLGLAIVKELVEAMGGHVSVRSPVPVFASAPGGAGGAGTEFAIALRPA
jgi:two-component system sensor histidine kinase BaeS